MQKPWRVILQVDGAQTARDISPLVRSVKDKINNPNPQMPLVTDGEAVFFNDARFELLRIETITKPGEKGGEPYVYVRELP